MRLIMRFYRAFKADANLNRVFVFLTLIPVVSTGAGVWFAMSLSSGKMVSTSSFLLVGCVATVLALTGFIHARRVMARWKEDISEEARDRLIALRGITDSVQRDLTGLGMMYSNVKADLAIGKGRLESPTDEIEMLVSRGLVNRASFADFCRILHAGVGELEGVIGAFGKTEAPAAEEFKLECQKQLDALTADVTSSMSMLRQNIAAIVLQVARAAKGSPVFNINCFNTLLNQASIMESGVLTNVKKLSNQLASFESAFADARAGLLNATAKKGQLHLLSLQLKKCLKAMVEERSAGDARIGLLRKNLMRRKSVATDLDKTMSFVQNFAERHSSNFIRGMVVGDEFVNRHPSTSEYEIMEDAAALTGNANRGTLNDSLEAFLPLEPEVGIGLHHHPSSNSKVSKQNSSATYTDLAS